MKIQEAIEKAILGGYEGYPKPFCTECGGYQAKDSDKYPSMFLDPAFWQALGKEMGWAQGPGIKAEHPELDWILVWHALIDHLAEGGSVETYFEKL